MFGIASIRIVFAVLRGVSFIPNTPTKYGAAEMPILPIFAISRRGQSVDFMFLDRPNLTPTEIECPWCLRYAR